MKRRIATVLLIILASIAIVGEPNAPAGGEAPTTGGTTKPQGGGGAKPESQAKTESEIFLMLKFFILKILSKPNLSNNIEVNSNFSIFYNLSKTKKHSKFEMHFIKY